VAKIPFMLGRVGPGDVVAFWHPDYGSMIKVVDAVTGDGDRFYVLGTHPRSIDSRHFGTVGKRDLIGKVLWHIKQEGLVSG
jgi:hypothetical protein